MAPIKGQQVRFKALRELWRTSTSHKHAAVLPTEDESIIPLLPDASEEGHQPRKHSPEAAAETVSESEASSTDRRISVTQKAPWWSYIWVGYSHQYRDPLKLKLIMRN
jgi:hypothetical protein